MQILSTQRAALLLLFTAFTTRVHAQLGDLMPGVRIRFGATAYQQRLDGTIIARAGDSVVVASPAGVQRSRNFRNPTTTTPPVTSASMVRERIQHESLERARFSRAGAQLGGHDPARLN